MTNSIPLRAAAQRDNIPIGKLYGHALRDLLDDPLIVGRDENGDYLMADDWRLQKLANSQQSNKSNG